MRRMTIVAILLVLGMLVPFSMSSPENNYPNYEIYDPPHDVAIYASYIFIPPSSVDIVHAKWTSNEFGYNHAEITVDNLQRMGWENILYAKNTHIERLWVASIIEEGTTHAFDHAIVTFGGLITPPISNISQINGTFLIDMTNNTVTPISTDMSIRGNTISFDMDSISLSSQAFPFFNDKLFGCNDIDQCSSGSIVSSLTNGIAFSPYDIFASDQAPDGGYWFGSYIPPIWYDDFDSYVSMLPPL